jgi:hypothetical protein
MLERNAGFRRSRLGVFLKQNEDLPVADLIRLLRADANEASHEARALPDTEVDEQLLHCHVRKTLADAIQAEGKAR